MKNKNKIIWIFLILSVVFSLSLGFKKYVIDKDYYVYMHAPCVAEDSTCFSSEDELYLKVYRKAFKIEQCMDGGCDPYVCDENEIGCLTTTCSESDLEEGEKCNVTEE